MHQNTCMFYHHHRNHPCNCRHMNPKYFYICHIHDKCQCLFSMLLKSNGEPPIMLGFHESPTYVTFVDIVTNPSISFKTFDAFANMGTKGIVTRCKDVTKVASAITLMRRLKLLLATDYTAQFSSKQQFENQPRPCFYNNDHHLQIQFYKHI